MLIGVKDTKERSGSEGKIKKKLRKDLLPHYTIKNTLYSGIDISCI